MEEVLAPEQTDSSNPGKKVCINCSSPDILEGYRNSLCQNCREAYIKFPIPKWIKIFGGVVAALVVFSLFTLPKNLYLGLHLEKGIKAEKGKKYRTAEKEFKEVVAKAPENAEANAHLFISSFYNQDFEILFKTGSFLQGKTIKDEDLLQKVDALFTESAVYFGSDTAKVFRDSFAKTGSIPESAYRQFLINRPEEKAVAVEYASVLFDKKQYDKADSVLQKIIYQDEEYVPALTLLSGIKRYQKLPQASLLYAEKLLNINKENTYGLSSKARALLMMKKDKEAKQLAIESYKLDETNPFSLATLAIAYHYNNDIKERDALVEKAKASKDSATHEYFQYALDVINNKEKLRD